MAMFVTGSGSPFPVGANPVSNATADIDGDGDLDILATNYISDNVSVLFNNGSGVFTAGTPAPVVNGPREIDVGDIDGDGDIDFVVANYSGNSISVLRNNGAGSFSAAPAVPVGTVPRYVALGDVDGDGDLDIAAANYISNTISVMLNNGSGAFAPATGSPVAAGTRPVGLVLGDLDGDGDVDMAVANNNSNQVRILLNNSAGVFTTAPGLPVAVGVGPRGIAAGDLDRDGDLDLVVGNFGANTLTVLRNNGSAGFAPFAGSPLTTGANPYHVEVGDIDGDGDLDIAVTNSGSSSLSVFLNNGSATFTAVSGSPFAVGVSPGGVAMADFDGDGDLDLTTANFGSNTASVLINAGRRIVGTEGKDTVDASQGVSGQPLPTDFGDRIFGLQSRDRLSGLGGDNSIHGDQGKDIIDGGAGGDRLFGGAGKNTLTGGTENDAFVFDTKLGKGKDGGGNKSAFSKVLDFAPDQDEIQLSHTVFKKLDPGLLSDDVFRDIGEKATKETRIAYKENGYMTYDKDGKGNADAVVFAKLTNKPDIDADDILVLA